MCACMHVWMYGCMEAQPKIQIPQTQASIYFEGTTPPRSPHVARAAEEEAGAGFGGLGFRISAWVAFRVCGLGFRAE